MTALGEHFVDVVLDGELVVAGPGGRLDFTALTGRFAGNGHSRAMRASYLVFDALSAGGTDLRGFPYRVRRAVLERLLDGARPPLAIVPMTTDGAAAHVWLNAHLEEGIEGVVAKRLDHAYSPAKRAWSKVRGRCTAEAVVGGVLGPISAPVALVVGRRDEQGRLRVAGRTTPIPRPARAAVGQALRPAGDWHPWPPVLPPARFGGAAPVEYTRVMPDVVVELAVDAAVDVVRGRLIWRHPAVYQRVRADLLPSDLPPAADPRSSGALSGERGRARLGRA